MPEVLCGQQWADRDSLRDGLVQQRRSASTGRVFPATALEARIRHLARRLDALAFDLAAGSRRLRVARICQRRRRELRSSSAAAVKSAGGGPVKTKKAGVVG